jgi:enamine deaminase RidA (YjgF/YER057c/UK114 family)
MRVSYEERLRELGFEITAGDLDAGRFVRAVRTGNLVYTAGAVSNWDGKVVKGKVGEDLTTEEGYEAARLSAVSSLSAVKSIVGSLDKVVRVVKVLGMVNVAPGFDDTPGVIHGCSDLINQVFGDAGKHARSAVGMTIPFNFAVEVEMVVEVE